MPGRIVLATLNAKFIHASLGLRYLLANMEPHGSAQLRALTSLREFTIHRPLPEVVQGLLDALDAPLEAADPQQAGAGTQVVGLGVYIWNLAQTTELVRLLKAQRPGVKVVLGGPEVSFETASLPIVALADHVITGWGDVSFPRLCQALLFGPRPLQKIIPGEQPPLEEFALPYALYSDADIAQRLLYVEASRGCPYQCAFCLSSLDKTAWSFDLDAFLDALAGLLARGARSFKFVDRTFNLKLANSRRILQFFLDWRAQHPAEPLFLHFELVPDHLPERLRELIVQFPAGVLQFEVGIQSWNPQVQAAIDRRQDNALAESNLRWLRQHSQAHLHTDLIFGLPGESWQSFAEGFDRLLALEPQEIQLGLLKRLRGTPLARRSGQAEGAAWGMVFGAEPPYAVQQTASVSAQEVQAFARLARYWDLVASSGRFPRTLRLLLGSPQQAPAAGAFAALAAFSDWLWQRLGRTHRISPEELVDALFAYLTQQRQQAADAVRAALRADYSDSGARASPACLRDLPAGPRAATLEAPCNTP